MPNLIGWLLLAAIGAVLLLQLWALRQRSGAPGGAVLRELELAAREQEKLETRLREELVRNRDEAGKGTAQLRTELARVLQEQQKGITDNLDRIRQQPASRRLPAKHSSDRCALQKYRMNPVFV